MTKRIRVVFMGTPAFSVPTLDTLLADERFEVLGVLTQPDKPSGRGQKLMPTPVKQRAEAAGLPVFQPKSLRKDPDVMAWLTEQAPDFFVTIAFGQILSQAVLDIPKIGTVNVHASLLPKLRGPNPIQQAVLQGLHETGITTMLTDIGVDTGPMLLRTVLAIGPDETAGVLATRMADAGGPLLVDSLAALSAGTLKATPQDDALATHAPKCEKADAAIDWTQPADKIHRQIRAFNPAPGAYTEFGGQRVKLLQSRLPQSFEYNSEEILNTRTAGEIDGIIKEGILVGTGDQPILITRLQPAGKKDMAASDWANGILQHAASSDSTQEPARFSIVVPV